MKIDFVKYKESYFKIRSTEDLFQALEDHSVNVSSMKSSPYYPAFSTDLDMWEKTLALISEIIDLQLNVQRQWMYLESIVSLAWRRCLLVFCLVELSLYPVSLSPAVYAIFFLAS